MKLHYLIGIMLLALVLAGCARPPPLPEVPKCDTKECFIAAANDCNDIGLTLDEDFGVIEYTSKECMLTKKVISLDPSETKEMKELVEGKWMTCKYEKGEFDRNWLDSLILGMQKCEGKLKETLVDILLFA